MYEIGHLGVRHMLGEDVILLAESADESVYSSINVTIKVLME